MKLQMLRTAVIGVEPAVKYSFVYKGIQTGRKGRYKAELTLSPRLHVKPLITAIRTIGLPGQKNEKQRRERFHMTSQQHISVPKL